MAGNLHQSLSESSFETWIHLYRPHCFSNQTTISYYLQGELAAMCLDLGIRRRTKGERGLEDVMVDLWQKHGGLIVGDVPTAPGAPNSDAIPGIVHDDIRRSMNLVSNGRMGAELSRLVQEPTLPPIDDWAKGMGHSFATKSKPKPGDSVLGIKISTRGGEIVVTGFLPNSPARESLQVGDELISIDGRRIRDNSDLKSALRGKADRKVALLLNRRGGIISSSAIPMHPPELGVRLKGKGNAMWRSMLRSRRHIPEDSD
jgi:predicted metalloprotease with PDZ domain